jgi:transposase
MLHSTQPNSDQQFSSVQALVGQVQTLQLESCELKAALDEERRRNTHYAEEIDHLTEQLRQFKREVFGKRSERWVPVEQRPLFNEAEILAAQAEPGIETEADKIEVKAHTKARGKRKPLPENLPREIVVVDIAESEKKDAAGNLLVRLVGREVSEQLEYSPSSLKVLEIHRLKYETINSKGESVVKTAEVPPHILPKSMATASLVAGIATHKFGDGLPFYRLEEIFERAGVTLPRQTQARWIVSCAKQCRPLWNVLEEKLMSAPYVSVDETWTQVLKEKGRPAESKSWMWVRANPGCDKKIILFDYDPRRTGEVAKRLFQDYKGFLQADGYDAYGFTEKNPDITRLGCNMHGRRYFDQARVSGLEQSRGLAEQGLEYYGLLYEIEERARELKLSFDDRFELRLKEAVPIWGEMKIWAQDQIQKVVPKGKIGRAFHYFLAQYDYLRGYLRDGRLEIDNGFVERNIRKFAIGRNNWMFSDTVDGAEASSLFYSFVITAKVNGIDPYRALKKIFEELPLATTIDDFERLADYLLIPLTVTA